MSLLKDNKKYRFPFESYLTPEESSLLVENSNIVTYHKKDVIFRQNTRTSHIMFVLSGLVKIYKIGRNTKSIILRLSGKNEFIGMMSNFGDTINQYSSAALEDTDVCYIDINIFKEVLENNGKLALHIIQKLSQQGLFIFQRLMGQSHKQLPGRIADVILYFSNDIYNSLEFSFPLTRKELAELSGTTKESFIRTLAEFKHDKIIDLDGSDLKINSLDIIKILSELG